VATSGEQIHINMLRRCVALKLIKASYGYKIQCPNLLKCFMHDGNQKLHD